MNLASPCRSPLTVIASIAIGLGLVIGSIYPARAEWYGARRGSSVLIYTASKSGPTLSLECGTRDISVSVFWQQSLSGSFSQAISYAIDDQVARSDQWRLSRDKRSVGLWGTSAVQLVRRLMNKQKLWIRASSAHGTVEATFDLEGFERAVQPIARTCRLFR